MAIQLGNNVDESPELRDLYEYLRLRNRARYEAKGRVILRVLEARGIEVPNLLRTRILCCKLPPERLETWLIAALYAERAEDLVSGLDEPGWLDELLDRTSDEVEERAKAILAILSERGIAVPDTIRERILRCTDLATSDTWLVNAVHAERAEDVFAERIDANTFWKRRHELAACELVEGKVRRLSPTGYSHGRSACPSK